MYATSVTIGRNYRTEGVYGSPVVGTLSDASWAAFQADITGWFTDYAAAINSGATGDDVLECFTETHYGVGSWDGVTEESARITFLCAGTFNPSEVRALSAHLADTARRWNQDAVALVLNAPSNLIRGL